MAGNHEYNTPSEGTTDWHVPLNENFQTLDADVEVRAPEGDRSQYEPKDGAKFLATDTGAVYLGDGSAWNELGSVGDTGGSSSGVEIVSNPGDLQSVIDEHGQSDSFGITNIRRYDLIRR